MKRAWTWLGVAAAAALYASPAAAGSTGRPGAFPDLGPTSGVEVYVPNPDPQPPIYWSQGTEPPPPQQGVDYGGGFLQYLITGTEDRPQPRHAPSSPSRYRNSSQIQAYVPGYVASVAPSQNGLAPDRDAAPVRAAIDPMYRRQDVAYAGAAGPGTIVVDTTNKFLYLVETGGHALRYGIGVARPGFLWRGEKTITRKAEWPDWTPPGEMIARRPDLPRHMDGGMANPLGARALYLGSSLYRIHGTNEPDTIGTNVSSGCIRLLNEDVADLYGRVRVGTRVLVL